MKSEFDDKSPIFLQIKESIEEDILNGHLKPDEQIPSVRQLVSFYSVNPVTVLKGVNLLADERVVYQKRGVGMFVSPDAPERLRQKFRENFIQDHVEPLVRLAVPLGISLEELRDMISRKWEENSL
jgi:DNA-binding transcriptional regulator YhcF (GntR family)